MPTWDIIKQIRALQLRLEVIQSQRQFVRDRSACFSALQPGVFLPDAVEFSTSILRDLRPDIPDIALVERTAFPILQIVVFLSGEREPCKDFEGGSDTTLVGAWILEEDGFALLEVKTCLLGQTRLAPSTIYLKWGLPSASTSAAMLEMLTAPGL